MPTESQPRDTALRACIRQRIDDGRLPVFVPSVINAGYGSSSKCDACDQAITRDQIAYEVAVPEHDVSVKLHLGCHVFWQIECADRLCNGVVEGT